MHLQNTADSLIAVLYRVVNCSARTQCTGVHTEIAQLSNKWVSRNLKCKCREGLIVGCMTILFLACLRVYTTDCRDVGRSRHIVDDRIQELLHALVLIGSTTSHWNHRIGNGGLTDCTNNLFPSELFTGEIFLHELVVLLSNMLKQCIVIFLGNVNHILRNILDAHILAHVVIVDVRLHIDQVDDPTEGIFAADRKLNRNGITLQALLHHLDDIIEVSAHDVHLIDIRHTRNMIFLSLAPNRFGLGLNATLCAENGYRTVQYAQGTFHLNGEVHVAGSVNDVDAVAFPEAGRSSRGNRDTSLLLLRHPVHRCSTVVRLADLVVNTRIIQNTFCRRCFTGIDVRHDTDIAGHFE